MEGNISRRKRAPNAFAIFVREHWRGRDRNQPFSDFNKELAERWQTLTEDEKNGWKALAVQERERWVQQMAKRTNAMPTRSRGRVKRPRSAYIFFCNEKRAQVLRENPGSNVTTVSKILGRMWSRLAPAEKHRYVKMADIDRRRYFTQIGKSPAKGTTAATPKRATPRGSAGPSKRRRPPPSECSSTDTETD